MIITLILAQRLVTAQESVALQSYHAHYTMSYEQIDITSDETMGLLGIGMHFDLGNYWFGGVDLYGAVDGERGGFFTVGAEGGVRYDLSDTLQLKSALFIGAGGGGAAPQGGGLMIRPYAEIGYHTPDYTVGAGISYINFPNGDIESTQAMLSLEIPTEGSYLSGHHFDANLSILSKEPQTRTKTLEVSFYTEHYVPDSDSLNIDGTTPTAPFSLAGIKFDKTLTPHLYSYFQAAGAGDGDSDGYMEIFGGLGYRYQLGLLPLTLGIEAAVGASGGGKVDTGGGLVYRTQAILNTSVTKHLTLGAFGGIIRSVDGSFSADSYGFTLGYKSTLFDTLSSTDSDQAHPSAWRFRMLNKSYLDGEEMFKDEDKGVDRVDLLGFAVDWYFDPHFYLTGQSYWAYKGEAGGYAEGIFGLGYQSSTYNGFSLYGEALAGVGGGGGIDIGGGLWGSVGGGVNYTLNDTWELTLGAAYMRNKADSFSTTAVTFGVSYNFSLLEKQ